MFTGIIEAVGSIQAMTPVAGDVRLTIASGELDMSDVQLGDSIAVNGVCLTAIEFNSSSFSADVSNETLSLTSLEQLSVGSQVNLEKALLPTSRLGGHLVSGHVDGLGELVELSADARSIKLRIEAPDNLKRYIAVKGSICIDGISLTVNAVDDAVFEINIVPHTQQRTIIQGYRVGQKVNLEVDLIARYLERLLLNLPAEAADKAGSDISKELLMRTGFIS
jgi:riboflavin synthase